MSDMNESNLNFDKFISGFEEKDKLKSDQKKRRQAELDAWEARRRLDRLYREVSLNRVFFRR